MKNSLRRAACAAAAVALWSTAAQAALGGSVSSIDGDVRAFAAQRRAAVPKTGYTVHELATDAVTVREYVTASGTVFAVAWNGIANPDVRRLLGAHFEEYQAAAGTAPRRGSRRSQAVRSGTLVVERWGQMRNLQGRAYLPALVPAEVAIDAIR